MEFKNKLFDKLSDKNLVGIKVSFEDEGLDFIDVLNIKKFTIEKNIEILLKLSGAEAKRDFKDSNKIGVNKIVAPMIESDFAFSKYIKTAINFVDLKKVKLGFNMESKQSFENLENILSSTESQHLSAITVGRGDLTESYGLDRYKGEVNSSKIFDITSQTFKLGRKNNLKCYLGGSMNIESTVFVQSLIKEGLLDYFETRNVVFSVDALKMERFENLINLAFTFEKIKMETRRNYYETLYNEDISRLDRLRNL